jgi:Ni/Co efflux regulator RcnB
MKKLIVAAFAFMFIGATSFAQNAPAPKKETPKTHVAKKAEIKKTDSTTPATANTGHKKGKHKKHNS